MWYYYTRITGISIFGAILLSISFAQTQTLSFQNVKPGEGFIEKMIYTVVQDKSGFLWLGTANGLVRFDGFNFKKYPAPVRNSKNVNHIIEDNNGHIWIIGFRWIQVLDRNQDSIHKVFSNDSVRFHFTNGKEIGIKDSSGILWIGSNQGLISIHPSQKPGESTVTHHKFQPGDTTYEKENDILVLLLDRQQTVWMGTMQGLFYVDREEGRIKKGPFDSKASITALCEGKEGRIFVGTGGSGMGIFNPSNGQTKWILADENTPSLAGNGILQLAKDKKGDIWLYSGSYINRTFSLQQYDPGSHSIRTHLKNQTPPKGTAGSSLLGLNIFPTPSGDPWIIGREGLFIWDSGKSTLVGIEDLARQHIIWGTIQDIYEDQAGVTWFCVMTTGLLKFAPSTQKFKIFFPEKEEGDFATFLSPCYIDSEDHLWVAESNGASRYAFDTLDRPQLVQHFPFKIYSRFEDQDSNFWAVIPEGLHLFDKQTGTFGPPPHPDLSKLFGQVTLKDREGLIWVSTFGRGVFRANPETGEIVNYRHDPKDSTTIGSDLGGGVMLQDPDGSIWMAGRKGLKNFDLKTGHFTSYGKELVIDDILDDGKGNIWLCAQGSGLYRFHKDTRKFSSYTLQDGFPSDRLIRIVQDSSGKLWITSDNGLIYFNPDKETWRVYKEDDGLPSRSFGYGEGIRKNGEFLFTLWGGGVIRFHPEELKADSFPPKAAIVDFKLSNNPVPIGGKHSPLKTSITTADHLLLAHDQNVFSFEFSSLHFAAPDHNQYAYFMEGIDNEWNYVGSQRKVNFSGLPPGNYNFRIKAANHDGIWGDEKSIAITIRPPWWTTWWAYALYGLLLCVGLLIVYRFLKSRWEINAKLEAELLEAERLKELDTMKNRLFTHITHEFRTPLTLILGMADQIKNKRAIHMEEGADMIIRNGNSLLRLVNQMLDLTKLESGFMPVRMVHGDLITYLRHVIEPYQSHSRNKNIQLHLDAHPAQLQMDYDPEKITDILSNLLSNAMKFTSEGGWIKVGVTRQGSEAIIEVSDSGVGIRSEDLPHIFDRFYQARHTDSFPAGGGTGVGLSLVRELVKLLKGAIDVESVLGKGTTFRIVLPITGIAARASSFPPTPEFNDFSLPENNAPVQEELHSSKPVLLIVEDNPDVITYVSGLLQPEYQVHVARNGNEGVVKAMEIMPDIIISDVMMPKMDGFELCRFLKQDIRTSHIPIVLLTAKADQDSRITGFEKGADAYLAKPFNRKELIVRLEKLVELRKKMQARYQHSLPITEDKVYEVEDAFIKRVREAMEAHLDDDEYGILDLCKEIGMSRAQLYRKFKSLTGQTIGHYFRTFRLERAKELLLTTKLHISEIAFAVGFKDPSYFTRTFKEEFGASPSELRRTMRT